MPSIFDLYKRHREQIINHTIIRLHGPDRKGIEKLTGKNWSRVIAPKEQDIAQLTVMLADLTSRGVESFLYVNNHFEGSAPKTITRIEEALMSKKQ